MSMRLVDAGSGTILWEDQGDRSFGFMGQGQLAASDGSSLSSRTGDSGNLSSGSLISTRAH